jgi:hypothetical protein
MVRAILDGRKTMTRRIVRGASGAFWDHAGWYPMVTASGIVWRTHDGALESSMPVRCPYGQPGDRLWVRESFNIGKPLRDCEGITDDELLWKGPLPSKDPRGQHFFDDWCVGYAADGGETPWRPSIHMPRWASRITLEVTGVRVERLQDISEDDAEAEGGLAGYRTPPNPERGPSGGIMQVRRFATLWDTINADRAPWASNPWVWVVSFRTPAGEGG